MISQIKRIAKKVPGVSKFYKRLRRPSAARLALLRTLPKNAIGAEIGVHMGDFSEKIVRIAKPKKLYLIDPWKYETGEEYEDAWYGGTADSPDDLEARYNSVLRRFSALINEERIVVLRKPSTTALKDLPDESLDFVYIDGNHLYEFVKEDLRLSLQKVRPGGLISGDDYHAGGWWKGGVKKAVDELGWDDRVTLLWINGGQFVFRRN